MTQKELADLMGMKPHQIAAKCSSTNKASVVFTRTLLAMPKSMVEPFLVDEMKKYEEKNND